LISVGSVVQVHPGPPKRLEVKTCVERVLISSLKARDGAIAQLGEHLLCKQGVVGSIPTGSSNGERSGDKRQLLRFKKVVCCTLKV